MKMSENCPTGCHDPEHMTECSECGAIYHIGIVHHCSTGGKYDIF